MSAKVRPEVESLPVPATKLLISDRPLQVLPSLAAAIGLNEAIALQQLHYWMRKSDNLHDGRKWVYNTYEQWQEQFPFWSVATIQRVFLNLEKIGVVIARRLEAHNWDQRKWYTVDYEALADLEEKSCHNSP